MSNILHVIKTKSLASDGRLLKWLCALQQQNFSSEVFIVEDQNRVDTYQTDYAAVRTDKLKARTFFKKGKGFAFKVPEFSYRSLKAISRSKAQVLVFHDMQHYLTLFLISFFKMFSKKKLVWDLHELPHSILCKNPVTRSILRMILEHMDLLVYTNEARRRYMLENIKYKEGTYVVLNNYPDRKFVEGGKSELPSSLAEWLKGEPYVLWMGAASKGRNFDAVLEAYKEFKGDWKLVIMGSIDPEYTPAISEIGNDRIFSKFVSQEEIVQYVDNAQFSIVLYKQNSPNNIYCEPNRLYQLVSRGVPVICGSNPPMESVISENSCGIVLDGDGSKVDDVSEAMWNMKKNYEQYKTNSILAAKSEKFMWEAQIEKVIRAISDLNVNYNS